MLNFEFLNSLKSFGKTAIFKFGTNKYLNKAQGTLWKVMK